MTTLEDEWLAGAADFDDPATEQDPAKVLAHVKREAGQQAKAARAEWKADGWQRAEELEAENHRLKERLGSAQRPSQPGPSQPSAPAPRAPQRPAQPPQQATRKQRGNAGGHLAAVALAGVVIGGVFFALPHLDKPSPPPVTTSCPLHAKPGYYQLKTDTGPETAYCAGSLFDTPKGNPTPSMQQVIRESQTPVTQPAPYQPTTTTTYTKTTYTSSTPTTVLAPTPTYSNAQILSAEAVPGSPPPRAVYPPAKP